MVAEAATRQKPIYLFHLPKVAPKVKPGLEIGRLAQLAAAAEGAPGYRLPADPMDQALRFLDPARQSSAAADIDQLESNT